MDFKIVVREKILEVDFDNDGRCHLTIANEYGFFGKIVLDSTKTKKLADGLNKQIRSSGV